MELYIYINDVARRVEMFNDEKVSVTSSITNYTDIGKLFTDYSQTFTIPASNVNNSIFSHWYESAIEGGFDARVRYDGYIELDTIPFRKGTLKLTKANQKNGYIESYSVTFYGVLTQLKDRFKDDKLNVLDYSSLKHSRTAPVIREYIRGAYLNIPANNSVFYPLIGNAKKLEYGTGSVTNDIMLSSSPVEWEDLFPAVRVTKIMEFIQTKYGITFTGNFLNYKQFTQLVMLFKNAELPRVNAEGVLLSGFYNPTPPAPQSVVNEYDIATNILTPAYQNSINNTYFNNYKNDYKIKIFNITQTPTPYVIEVYNNGILYNSLSSTASQVTFTYFTARRDAPPINLLTTPPKFTFKIATNVQRVIPTATLIVDRFWKTNTNTNTTSIAEKIKNNTNITPKVDVQKFCPEIKVADFITGLVKMFNLIITPVNETTFKLEPLELYYQSGKITDLTEYIYSDEVEINAPTLNKSLNFMYEKSENILNNFFRQYNNREYGDLIYNDANISDGGSYEVKLPFENPMWERTTGRNFQTCTFLNKDEKPYTPKPVLMYIAEGFDYSSQGFLYPPYYIRVAGGGTDTESDYVKFGNENTTLPNDLNYLQTLNWGVEVSTWYLENAVNGIYNRLYDDYIANLYNLKSRVLKVKARLSKYLIANIELKDRVLIRDKRYLINTMTFDLTTNETTLELITDYRVLGTTSVGYRYSNANNIYLDSTDATTFQLDLYLGVYNYISIASQTSGWVQWTASGYFYADKSVEITIAQNTTGVDRNDIFLCKFSDTNGTEDTYVVYINQKG